MPRQMRETLTPVEPRLTYFIVASGKLENYLIGRTPIGRVTVALLHINDDYRVELREGLIAEGVFPPA